MSRPRSLPVLKICRACGLQWEAASAYAIKVQVFCSRACRTMVHGNGRPRVPKVERSCGTCGKTMWLLQCQLPTKRYCSYSCSNKATTGSGEQNPAWKGGSEKYWKKKARERDDFTCQYPGCVVRDTGRRVHAHHKVPRSIGGADTPDNLVSLCERHHRTMERELLCIIIKKHPDVVRDVASGLYAGWSGTTVTT